MVWDSISQDFEVCKQIVDFGTKTGHISIFGYRFHEAINFLKTII